MVCESLGEVDIKCDLIILPWWRNIDLKLVLSVLIVTCIYHAMLEWKEREIKS